MKTILDETRELASSTHNHYLEEAKKQGKKIIGYFCSYMPEEIIHAAGFVPYRMRAVESKSTTKADAYYSSINCTFVKHCFNKALNGDFDFLDGVVFVNGCDHSRRMYDNWRYAGIGPSFLYMFFAPHMINEPALEYFSLECSKLKSAIEKHFQISITDKSLKNSISLYNQKRRLLAEIYALRKNKNVPIKASELLGVMLAVTAVPVEKAIDILTDVKKFIEGRVVSKPDDMRLFISGGCIEELEHLELIEDCGCVIVADNICLGARHFLDEVGTEGDPLQAIAQRYLSHLSCPRMMGDFQRRLDYLLGVRKEYGIDGAIIEKLKFCDIWGGEMYLYRVESKNRGIPLLALERELHGGGAGQVKTRVQAFLEKLKNKQATDEGMVQAAGTDYKPK
ncbi:MAG: 2-hydroxyacyl-CoA dehydratase [Deltaproteobacteria bacterium HGW-Deltaproteobacteria-2]|jgi:benzoyl-CoA reductase/2-hydroxyglutaryl-CoA dehydratase subunit BcrC/BadD/HgdB|nr:MAG: 2-hydroxyacyl-CoA dehydratase [Deltaproteobacteria bacterium HGW-Deltaproteobacteria-2]